MTTRYEGGCHCGAVRFRVDVEDHRAAVVQLLDVPQDGLPARHRPARALRDPARRGGADDLHVQHPRREAHVLHALAASTPSTGRALTPTTGTSTRWCLDDGAAARFRVEPFDGQNWEASVDAIRDRRS